MNVWKPSQPSFVGQERKRKIDGRKMRVNGFSEGEYIIQWLDSESTNPNLRYSVEFMQTQTIPAN